MKKIVVLSFLIVFGFLSSKGQNIHFGPLVFKNLQNGSGSTPIIVHLGDSTIGQIPYSTIPNQLGFVSTPSLSSGVWSYDKFWTLATDNGYTVTGVTTAVSGNKVQITGSGNNYAQQYSKTQFSYLEHWMKEDTVVINSTISSTTYGIGTGINTTANLGYVDLTNTGTAGTAYIVTNGTTRATSSGVITFATGDTLIMKFQRMRDTLFFTVTDKANASTQTLNYIVANTFVYPLGTDLIHKIGQYSLFVKGGQYTVVGSKVTNLEPYNPPLAVVGDSKTQGYYANAWNSRFGDKLNLNFARTVNFGSSGDLIANLLSRIQDVISVHPQQVVLCIGSNDYRSGSSMAVVWPLYQAAVGILQANGIKVFHLTLPEGTAIATQLKQFDSLVRATYPGEYLPVYDKVRACPTCLVADSIHITAVGNDSTYQGIIQSNLLAANTYQPSLQISNLTPLSVEYVKTKLNIVTIGGNNVPSTGTFHIGTNSSSGIPVYIDAFGKPMVRLNYQSVYSNPTAIWLNYAGAETARMLFDTLLNTAIGNNVATAAASTQYLTAFGASAAKFASGNQNTSMGAFSSAFQATGIGNAGYGYQALYGFNSGTSTTNFSYATGLGYNAGKLIGTGADSSIFIGAFAGNNAGTTNISGHGVIVIGSNDTLPTVSTSDFINIGHVFYADRNSRRVSLGNQTIANTYLSLSASTTAYSSLNIPSGTAPTSPSHGDIWTDASHIYARLNGVTYQLDQQSAGSSNPFADNTALVKNNSDNTKLLILSAASISTATTRTWTFPDVNGTVARNDAAQTFTGVQTFSSAPTLSSLTTNGGLLFDNGSGVMSQNANILFDATNNGLKLITPSIGITPTNAGGVYLQNATAASSVNQQSSPGLTLEGQGWKTTATAASQAVAFNQYVLPVQGVVNPSATWFLRHSINGGAYTADLTVDPSTSMFTVNMPTTIAGNLITSTGYIASNSLVGAGAAYGFTWGGGTTQPTIYADGANFTAIVRNGTNANELWVDNTYTDGTHYEAGVFGFIQNANILSIGTKTVGNTLRNIQFIGGTIGMGVAPVTNAELKLPAGSTTVAPLLLTSGTNLTAIANGAVEYNGTHFFGSTGGVRYQLDQQVSSGWLVSVSSAGTLALTSASTDYVFSGTTATWTLPAVSGNTGTKFFFKNRGSGVITLNSNIGGADIYDLAAVTSITINPGEAYTLVNDGTYWLVE